MSQEVTPQRQLVFHGLYTDDNPIGRPAGTSTMCKNFRIMPGYWLRLRGGRKSRVYSTDLCQQIFPFHTLGSPGAGSQMAQFLAAGPACRWKWFSLLTYAIDPTGFNSEPISLAYDSAFSQTNPAAITQTSDRVVIYNGLGVRDGSSTSQPPLTSFDGTTIRYFGLDAYCPSGNPTVAFAAGAGFNTVGTKISVWVGLYHQATNHFSNAVYAGAIATTGASGTITVSNLSRHKYASHNATELSELFYVFYCTIDGGAVPYQVLDSALDGPAKVAVGSSSFSLSIATGTTNGFNLDMTKESPIDNFPPRPMRSICYINGRMYGALLQGGSGSAISQPGDDGISRPDFTYVPNGGTRDMAGVVFSRALGDVASSDKLGDPLQSWPLANVAYTPTSETPIVVTRSMDDVRALVITASATFLLEETLDGTQEFHIVSLTHGITNPATLCVTDYGITWMSQRNIIVQLVYGRNTADENNPSSMVLKNLSDKYQSFTAGLTPTCADYLLDPINDIDRYQVFFSDQSSLIHDFRTNEAYSCTHPEVITAARTSVDSFGVQHHIVARNGFYTQENQPDTQVIPTRDDFYSSPSTVVTQEINGEYRRNWDSFGDPDVTKGIWEVLFVGDGAPSVQLSGASPVVFEWYPDFAQLVSGNKVSVLPIKAEHSAATDSLYRLKMATAYRRWYRLVFKLSGHATDDTSYLSHANTATQGDLAKNFYGSILMVMYRLRTEDVRT